MSDIRQIVGDCREAMHDMPSCSFDCIVTDPPYGVTNLSWDQAQTEWVAECRRVLKPSGSMWVFGSLRSLAVLLPALKGWRMAQDVVWEKHNGSSFHADRFRRVHEHAVQLYLDDAPWSGVYRAPQYVLDATARVVRKKARPAHWHGATGAATYVSEDGGPRLMRSVIAVRSEHGRAVHPTQKPIGIIEPLVLSSCPPAGHVLDPFSGSGTVGLVADRHGMAATLVELSAGYAAVASSRLLQDRISRLPPEMRRLID